MYFNSIQFQFQFNVDSLIQFFKNCPESVQHRMRWVLVLTTSQIAQTTDPTVPTMHLIPGFLSVCGPFKMPAKHFGFYGYNVDDKYNKISRDCSL